MRKVLERVRSRATCTEGKTKRQVRDVLIRWESEREGRMVR